MLQGLVIGFRFVKFNSTDKFYGVGHGDAASVQLQRLA